MKIHSEQLFNYLQSRGFELTAEDKANIVEIILFGKNDRGKYSQQREKSFGGWESQTFGYTPKNRINQSKISVPRLCSKLAILPLFRPCFDVLGLKIDNPCKVRLYRLKFLFVLGDLREIFEINVLRNHSFSFYLKIS